MDLIKYKLCVEQLEVHKLDYLKHIILKSKSIIILGNGGSNAISCHIAEDYTKMLGIKTFCFGDSARLSCYANDYGWENAYVKFIEHFKETDTLVILISSSGNSTNIVKCAEYCLENNLKYITLTGFNPDNTLRKNYGSDSVIDFHINSNDYGIVESLHELILHSII
jgi:D-sedoheptulose 7-phosphate isomerase